MQRSWDYCLLGGLMPVDMRMTFLIKSCDQNDEPSTYASTWWTLLPEAEADAANAAVEEVRH